MSKFKKIELVDGNVLVATLLAKTISAIIVRTEDNKYLLVARSFLKNPETIVNAEQ